MERLDRGCEVHDEFFELLGKADDRRPQAHDLDATVIDPYALDIRVVTMAVSTVCFAPRLSSETPAYFRWLAFRKSFTGFVTHHLKALPGYSLYRAKLRYLTFDSSLFADGARGKLKWNSVCFASPPSEGAS